MTSYAGRRQAPVGVSQSSPDVCRVTRVAPGVFQVTHFPDAETEKGCCSGRIETTAADRATAAAEGIHVDIVTLRRCDVAFNKKHGGAA